MSINRVVLSGNVGRDPELRATSSGSSILTFSLAVSERVRNSQSGEWSDYTNWLDVVVFGKRADGLHRILSKGMKVAVEGRLRYSSWERDGQKRSKVEVIADNVDLMQRRDSSGQSGNGERKTNNYTNGQQNGAQNGSQGRTDTFQEDYDVYDEDMPF